MNFSAMTSYNLSPIYCLLFSILIQGRCAYGGSKRDHFTQYPVDEHGYLDKSNNGHSGDTFKSFRNHVLAPAESRNGQDLGRLNKLKSMKRMISEYTDYPTSDYVSGKMDPDVDEFPSSQDVMLQASVRLPIPPRRRRAFKSNVINRIAHGFGKRTSWAAPNVDDVDDVLSRSDVPVQNVQMYRRPISGMVYEPLQETFSSPGVKDRKSVFLDLLKSYLHAEYNQPSH